MVLRNKFRLYIFPFLTHYKMNKGAFYNRKNFTTHNLQTHFYKNFKLEFKFTRNVRVTRDRIKIHSVFCKHNNIFLLIALKH